MTISPAIKNLQIENRFFIQEPTWIDAMVLSAGTAASYTVPNTAKFLIFSANTGEFYLNPNGTAAVPGGNVTDGSASEMNPTTRRVNGAQVLSFIAPANTIITIAVYS